MTSVLSEEMPEKKLPIPKYEQCQRCGHAWFRKTPSTPRQCPKCWSRDWNQRQKKDSK